MHLSLGLAEAIGGHITVQVLSGQGLQRYNGITVLRELETMGVTSDTRFLR